MSGLSICLINANTVRNKTCLLLDFVTDNEINIMCVTETWIKENESAVIAALVPFDLSQSKGQRLWWCWYDFQ